MAPMALVIGPITSIDDLKTCTPNLMPFHIDYSGQALISTYLRVEAASETVGAPPTPEPIIAETSADVKTGETSTITEEIDMAMEGKNDTDIDPISVDLSQSPTLAKRVTDATMRFISSFRGRTIQGLKVQLPEGYGGIVLRGNRVADGRSREDADMEHQTKTAEGKGKTRAKPKAKSKAVNTSKGRVTRSATHVEMEDDAEDPPHGNPDVDMEEDGAKHGESDDLLDEVATRTLVPSSQFSSFILWHADNPVDEGKDEYFRSLSEWTRLAHEIHRVDD